MKRKLSNWLSLVFAVLCSVSWFVFEYSGPVYSLPTERVIDEPRSANALVVKVVDGDTVHAELLETGETETIRFLGVNTPESVDPRRPVECFGKEASRFMKTLLDGMFVYLESDPEADERDKYGRLLRTVFLKDGTNVNALLLQEGYAHAYLSFPMNEERKILYRRLEREAREGERGLWNSFECAIE